MDMKQNNLMDKGLTVRRFQNEYDSGDDVYRKVERMYHNEDYNEDYNDD